MPKRSRYTTDSPTPERDTSPPPPKRAKLFATAALAPASSEPITHILSWNVETPAYFIDLPAAQNKQISAYLTASSAPRAKKSNPLRDLITRHEFPDFVCLQEIRARHTDTAWITAIKAAANGSSSTGPQYEAYMSLSRSTRGQRHFGVVTLVKDPSRIAVAREVDWDFEGRVMILEMKSGWALVNVYALNGSEAPWRDPRDPDFPSLKTRNERKREFNRLLAAECRAMQARGLHLILIGDFNISLTRLDCHPRLRTEAPHALARKEFNTSFIPSTHLVDIFRAVHGEKKSYSWFAKSKPQGSDCARVDYALVEGGLVGRCVETGYLEAPLERAKSDHCPLVLKMRSMDNLEDVPLVDGASA